MKKVLYSIYVIPVILLTFTFAAVAKAFPDSTGKLEWGSVFGLIALGYLFIFYLFVRITNQKLRTKTEKITNQEYLRVILNSLEEGVITTDLMGTITGLNPSAETLTQWPSSEAIGKPLTLIYNVVNETTGKPFQNIVSRILAEGKTVEFENNTILLKKGGGQIIISNNGSPIRDTQGNMMGAVLVFRDITERKKQSEMLRQLNNRMVLATKSAGMGIWDWNLAEDKLIWDEGMYQLFGISRSDNRSVQDTWLTAIHPVDLARVMKETQEVVTGQKEYRIEFRIVWPDKSVRFLRATGVIEKDENGVVKRVTGANWDITERRKAEEQLRQSESFNRAVLNSLSAHIAVVEGSGEIIATSGAWKQFALTNSSSTITNTGVGVNYLAVCKTAANQGDRVANDALTGIKSVMQGQKETFSLEYPCHTPTEKKWFRMLVTQFGNSASMVVIEHQDITPIKLAELEKEELTYDLIQRNKNMEQFSFVVSHNLRAPLATIMGFAELLKYEQPDPKDLGYILKGIHSAAYNLDGVIRDLNEILQIKTQLFESKQEVVLDEIVKVISTSIDDVIKHHNAVILTDFKTIDRIVSIKSYIYSIFYNLIYNSIKYHKPGAKPLIEIKTEPTPAGVRLIFKDNGLGIDLQKNGEKLFGLYRRFHLNTEGKGMGLFMVKTQVETLGGKIYVNSKVNSGTEFVIEFDHIKP